MPPDLDLFAAFLPFSAEGSAGKGETAGSSSLGGEQRENLFGGYLQEMALALELPPGDGQGEREGGVLPPDGKKLPVSDACTGELPEDGVVSVLSVQPAFPAKTRAPDVPEAPTVSTVSADTRPERAEKELRPLPNHPFNTLPVMPAETSLSEGGVGKGCGNGSSDPGRSGSAMDSGGAGVMEVPVRLPEDGPPHVNGTRGMQPHDPLAMEKTVGGRSAEVVREVSSAPRGEVAAEPVPEEELRLVAAGARTESASGTKRPTAVFSPSGGSLESWWPEPGGRPRKGVETAVSTPEVPVGAESPPVSPAIRRTMENGKTRDVEPLPVRGSAHSSVDEPLHRERETGRSAGRHESPTAGFGRDASSGMVTASSTTAGWRMERSEAGSAFQSGEVGMSGKETAVGILEVSRSGEAPSGSREEEGGSVDTVSDTLPHTPLSRPQGELARGPHLQSTFSQPAIGGETATGQKGWIEMPLGDRAWEEQMAHHALRMAGEGGSRATLHLNPSNLGALDVQVTTDGEGARIQFHSHHAVVREAVEAALPRLREMFHGSGLNLVEVEISSRHGGHPGGEAASGDGHHQGREVAVTADHSETGVAEEMEKVVAPLGSGRLDYYI